MAAASPTAPAAAPAAAAAPQELLATGELPTVPPATFEITGSKAKANWSHICSKCHNVSHMSFTADEGNTAVRNFAFGIAVGTIAFGLVERFRGR